MAKKLPKSNKSWYSQWHDNPLHVYVHWFVVVFASFILVGVINPPVFAQ